MSYINGHVVVVEAYKLRKLSGRAKAFWTFWSADEIYHNMPRL